MTLKEPEQSNPDLKPTSRRTATIANLAYQYSGPVLNIIRGLVLVPLYLKFIDIKLYGAWLASGNVIVWLMLMDPGLNELLRQQVAKYYGKKDLNSLGRAIGTGWSVMICFSVITAGLGWVISKVVPSIFLDSPVHIRELQISLFLASIGAALVLSSSPSAVMQGLQRSGKFVLIFILGWIFGITATIVLLFKGFGLIALPLGSVISGAAILIGCSADMIYFTKRKLRIHLTWCKEYLNNIKGLIGATFALQFSRILVRNCDEFLIGIFLGTEVVPIVAFSKRLWDLALLFGQRISVAFMPGLAHLWGEGDRKKASSLASKMLRVTMWLVGIETAMILGFNRSFLGLWVGSQFFAGHLFNLLFALSMCTYVYIYAIGQILYAADDIKGPAMAGVIQSLLRTVIVLVLLNFAGIIALPVSTLISSVLVLVVYFRKRFSEHLAQKVLENEKLVLLSIIAAITLGLSAAYTLYLTSWLSLLIGVAAGLIIFSILIMILDQAFRRFVSNILIRVCKTKYLNFYS